MPESPSWLIVRGRLEDAEKSLCWLRGWVQPQELEKELQDLVNYTQKSDTKRESVLETSRENGGSCIRLDNCMKKQSRALTDKKVLRPLRFVCTALVISAVTRMYGMDPYMIRELNDLKSPLDSKVVLMINRVLFFVGIMGNVVFLRKVGKRKLALFSNAFAAAAIFGIGTYSSFLEITCKYPKLGWIPVVLLFSNAFLSGFSVLVLPWQLVCEVFPFTSTAIGVAAAWNSFTEFLMIKSFLYIEAAIHLSGVMYLHGAVTLLGTVYFYFYLPETEGKTLAEIESCFSDDCDPKEKFSIGSKSTEES